MSIANEEEDYAEWRRMRRRMYKTMRYGQTSGPPFVFDGEEFKAARKRLKLSRRETGLVLEISPNTVYKWEIGEVHPQGERMRRKAALFIAQSMEVA